MSAVQNHKISFKKMSGAGNDFAIFDARKSSLELTSKQITKISDRKNIGCDQLIIIKNSDQANCLMEIYNSDGSLSGACGNATRCVAAILFEESSLTKANIQTAAGILECWRESEELISVNMGIPSFDWNKIPLLEKQDSQKISLLGLNFAAVNVGNPHAVTFIKENISDQKFFETGPKIENNKIFPQRTNVEFAKIINDNLIEVRVWERGAGETLACGTGACAVGILAIKQNLISAKKVTIRFKGGDLQIEWQGEGKPVIMTGNYQKIFEGKIDESFL
jgi:diaminopimelate epimerase